MDANSEYSTVKSSAGIINRAALAVRQNMYRVLAEHVDMESLRNVLDVGATADRDRIESNYFEEIYPHKNRITVLSDQDASWLEEKYPGLKFVHGDGRGLPFPDDSFDLVFSNAVLEHVGAEAQQKQFMLECLRVSRKYVFLTTPNRWHPFEFHTAIPFLHWLPKSCHRYILDFLGYEELSKEENLNLLSKRNIWKIKLMMEKGDM